MYLRSSSDAQKLVRIDDPRFGPHVHVADAEDLPYVSECLDSHPNMGVTVRLQGK